MRAVDQRTFSLELKSVDSLKRVSMPNENLGGLLIEGSLGELESLNVVDGEMLEIKCTKGVLRADVRGEELDSTTRRLRL